jgi:hypothetical protein
MFFCSYIRRETAVFFGVEESSEEKQQAIWLDRRKRLAVRKYGSLKEEYLSPVTSPRPRRQLQQTSAYASQVRAQREITVLLLCGCLPMFEGVSCFGLTLLP